MQNDGTPVAARIDAAKPQTDANLHVQVGPATKRFHIWQQVPAWLLGFAAIGLGFLMVLRGYDSAAGWFAVSTAIVLSVLASFRSPFSIGSPSVSMCHSLAQNHICPGKSSPVSSAPRSANASIDLPRCRFHSTAWCRNTPTPSDSQSWDAAAVHERFRRARLVAAQARLS